MSEQLRNHNEQEFEVPPTPEQVLSVFKELAPEGFKETRRREDEKGLYLLEIEAPGKSENEYAEYAYMRKGRYPEGSITATEIHVTFYEDGMPVSGTTAAKYENGTWRILK